MSFWQQQLRNLLSTPAMKTAYAFTAPINPSSASTKLTRAQVWAGLVEKARDPAKYIPGIESCEVVEENGNGLTRMVQFKPGGPAGPGSGKVKEVVRFTKEVRVCILRNTSVSRF